MTIRLPVTNTVLQLVVQSDIARLKHFRGTTSYTNSVVISEVEPEDEVPEGTKYKRRYSNVASNVTEEQAIAYINLLASGIPYDIATSALFDEVYGKGDI